MIELLTNKNTTKMMTMTTNEMTNKMLNVNAGAICTIETISAVKMAKTNNPLFGRATKYVKTQLQWGYSYQNAVNNRLEKNGMDRDFESGKLPWGEWVVVNKVISHKGETYLRFYEVENTYKTQVVYFVDGREATREEIEVIKTYLPKKKDSGTQADAGLTEKQVKPHTYNVKNIATISVNGETMTNEMFSEIGVLK